jgi:hypothetical protein
MLTEMSLPYLKENATDLYPYPVKASAQHILSLSDAF